MKVRQLLIALSLELTLVVGFFVLVGRAAPSSPDPDPDPNTHSAPLTTSVSITYDEPISAATATSRTLAIHAIQTGLVTATPGVNGNTNIVTSGHAFHPGELVQTTAANHFPSKGGYYVG